jgi:capsular polysaccharide export protein
MNPRRSILLLQGPAGWCFARLAQALLARGHTVHKVNFNLGDRVFWRGPPATAYRGRAADWADQCARLIRIHRVTDLVLFGDCRPLHQAAIAVATRLGVRVLVAEEGYIRPDWVTFEPHGVNGNSTLPRDPAWYLTQAARLRPPPEAVPVQYSFARRAIEDLVYGIGAVAGLLAYPFYRTHRPWHPLLEYAGWAWQLLRRGHHRRRGARALALLAASGRPYFLFPLQLDCDYQLRAHSPFVGQDAAIERVLGSFARSAPPDCQKRARPQWQVRPRRS